MAGLVDWVIPVVESRWAGSQTWGLPPRSRAGVFRGARPQNLTIRGVDLTIASNEAQEPDRTIQS